MSDKPVLRVDWCSHEAAKFAVEHWHYSRCLPMGKTVKVGAWEGGEYVGCVVFGMGTNKDFGMAYGIGAREVCELNRVALASHKTQTSKIVTLALRMLKKQSDGLRLVVSFADPFVGHHGGIYQAMGWVYVGFGNRDPRSEIAYMKEGKRYSWRSVAQILHDRAAPATIQGAVSMGFAIENALPKHKYLYPLDSAMREQIAPLAKPYPKRDTCAASKDSVVPGPQPGEGGATPTAALQEITRDDGAG